MHFSSTAQDHASILERPSISKVGGHRRPAARDAYLFEKHWECSVQVHGSVLQVLIREHQHGPSEMNTAHRCPRKRMNGHEAHNRTVPCGIPPAHGVWLPPRAPSRGLQFGPAVKEYDRRVGENALSIARAVSRPSAMQSFGASDQQFPKARARPRDEPYKSRRQGVPSYLR